MGTESVGDTSARLLIRDQVYSPSVVNYLKRRFGEVTQNIATDENFIKERDRLFVPEDILGRSWLHMRRELEIAYESGVLPMYARMALAEFTAGLGRIWIERQKMAGETQKAEKVMNSLPLPDKLKIEHMFDRAEETRSGDELQRALKKPNADIRFLVTQLASHEVRYGENITNQADDPKKL